MEWIMTDEPASLVLEYLRRIDRKVDTVMDDTRSLNVRMSVIERHLAAFHGSDVEQTSEIARLKQRVDRIEDRLELRDT